MNECALLGPTVSGNGSMADTNQSIQYSSQALFVSRFQVVLDDVGHVRRGIELVAAVALAVALQTGGCGFWSHRFAFLMSSKMA